MYNIQRKPRSVSSVRLPSPRRNSLPVEVGHNAFAVRDRHVEQGMCSILYGINGSESHTNVQEEVAHNSISTTTDVSGRAFFFRPR